MRLAHAVGKEKDTFFSLLLFMIVQQTDAPSDGSEDVAAQFLVVQSSLAHLVHYFEQIGVRFGDGVQLE